MLKVTTGRSKFDPEILTEETAFDIAITGRSFYVQGFESFPERDAFVDGAPQYLNIGRTYISHYDPRSEEPVAKFYLMPTTTRNRRTSETTGKTNEAGQKRFRRFLQYCREKGASLEWYRSY